MDSQVNFLLLPKIKRWQQKLAEYLLFSLTKNNELRSSRRDSTGEAGLIF